MGLRTRPTPSPSPSSLQARLAQSALGCPSRVGAAQLARRPRSPSQGNVSAAASSVRGLQASERVALGPGAKTGLLANSPARSL